MANTVKIIEKEVMDKIKELLGVEELVISGINKEGDVLYNQDASYFHRAFLSSELLATLAASKCVNIIKKTMKEINTNG